MNLKLCTSVLERLAGKKMTPVMDEIIADCATNHERAGRLALDLMTEDLSDLHDLEPKIFNKIVAAFSAGIFLAQASASENSITQIIRDAARMTDELVGTPAPQDLASMAPVGGVQ